MKKSKLVRHSSLFFTVAATAALVSACGGAGGGSDSTSPLEQAQIELGSNFAPSIAPAPDVPPDPFPEPTPAPGPAPAPAPPPAPTPAPSPSPAPAPSPAPSPAPAPTPAPAPASGPVTLVSTSSTRTQVGASYSQTNAASGGTTPYRFSVTSGALPTGVALNTSTGLVSGTPTVAGSFSYTVRVTDALNATSSRTVSGTIASGFTAVQTSDVIYNFSASDIETYKYANVQCQGRNQYFWEWGGSSAYFSSVQIDPLYGTTATGQSFAAFSTVASPGETGKKAFLWDLRLTDPDTAGYNAKRCEFGFGWKEYSYPGKVLSRQVGLPANQDYWWAVAIRQEDLAATSTLNDWQILWQWHDAYGGGLPPFLTLMSKANHWYIQLAYDMGTTPSNATLTKVTPWNSAVSPNTWQRFVVKARKDLVTPSNSYVQVWLNGTQIVNYRGPFGYNVPQMDYAKVGIYKWISTANAWTPAVPSRRMWSKGPVQVNNRSGYTWQSINAMLD